MRTPSMGAVRRLAAPCVAAALVLAGCSSAPRQAGGGAGRDGPPVATESPNPMQAPPAEPKVEPIRQGGPNKPYEVLGQSYTPQTADVPMVERGLASWYGSKFHGRRTASGETYNMHAMTAAHKTMPIPSYARVRNPANGREVIVRINDRGPFVAGRVIDLSWAAAVQLGVQNGVRPVEVERITHDEIRAGLGRRESPPGEAPAAVGGVASASPPPAAPVAAVAPESPGAPPAAALPAADAAPAQRARALTAAAGGFWLQLGAFGRNEGALNFQRQVAQEQAWLAPLLAVFSEGGVHRLQAGPYPTREQAREAGARVREALQLVPVLVERR